MSKKIAKIRRTQNPLKNSEQGARFTYMGLKFGQNLLLEVKKIKIIFGVGNFLNYFLGSLEVTKFILGAGGVLGTSWVTFLYTTHLRRKIDSFKKKDGDTRYTRIK